MRSSTTNAAPAPTGKPVGRPNFGRAARRATRRATRLADELNMHAFRIHVDGSVTWTPRCAHQASGQPKPPGEGSAREKKREPSKRKQRGTNRAIAHRALLDKANAFLLQSLFRRWQRANPQPPPPLQPPPPPPQPLPEPEAWPALPQRMEHVDDERAPKRAHESPAAGALSPAPRAATKTQRALVLPGQPPPSNPPSPPSPTPTPPPPSGLEPTLRGMESMPPRKTSEPPVGARPTVSQAQPQPRKWYECISGCASTYGECEIMVLQAHTMCKPCADEERYG